MGQPFPKHVKELQNEIIKLKEDQDVFLMAHYYQVPEIQAVADVLGDSLGLSREAQKVKNDTIVFAGVTFMAETASILNPNKTVFIPDMKAICPMAEMCSAATVLKVKQQNPDIPVVLYVNTLAEAKAEADIMCTSANAVKVCKSLNTNPIIFGPDWNLGWHVNWRTGLDIIPVPEHGYCYVHKKFTVEDFLTLKKKYPNAEMTVHPECNPEVQELADYVGSTAGIKNYIKGSDATDFIIGTEIGLKFILQKEIGESKNYYFAREDGVCLAMKHITLEKIKRILVERPKENIVQVPKVTADAARKGIQKMLDLS